MPSKRRLDHLKAAREASVASFKKRRSEASLVSKSAQLEIDDSKLNTTDISDMKDEPGTRLCKREGKNVVDEGDLELEQSRTDRAASPADRKMEIKWKREGENQIRGSYGNWSRTSQKRQKKQLEN